jgi:hypothetical protein
MSQSWRVDNTLGKGERGRPGYNLIGGKEFAMNKRRDFNGRIDNIWRQINATVKIIECQTV